VRRRREPATGDTPHDRASRNQRLLIAYIVIALSGLIVLRATVDAVGFLSVGWIIVLVALPLLPWLVPRLGDFLKAISPYVQSIKVASIQLDLRTVRREPISIPSSGAFASVPNDVAALSDATSIQCLVSALRKVRQTGAGPVGVIDLRDGQKWRLPNVYFLCRLLEIDPVVSQLIFTEIRGEDDGYVVGSGRPDELARHIERTVPGYASALGDLAMPSEVDLSDKQNAPEVQKLGSAFHTFAASLPPAAPGWVTSEQIRTSFLGVVNPTAIAADRPTLSEEDVRAAVQFPFRYVPATARGRLAALIDRDAVALDVARAAVSS
jgi:hypothetical protein